MDDTAQKQNQVSDNVQAQVQPQVQPQPVGQIPLGGTQPQPQPQAQVTPVGVPNKEIEVAPVSDFVKPSEAAAIKDREVAEAGVVEAEQAIKLEEAHEKMGVRLSAESAPVKTEPTGVVQLPMDEQEAKKIVKKGSGGFDLGRLFSGIYFTDSIYGFAMLMLKHFKKIHRKLIGQPV